MMRSAVSWWFYIFQDRLYNFHRAFKMREWCLISEHNVKWNWPSFGFVCHHLPLSLSWVYHKRAMKSLPEAFFNNFSRDNEIDEVHKGLDRRHDTVSPAAMRRDDFHYKLSDRHEFVISSILCIVEALAHLMKLNDALVTSIMCVITLALCIADLMHE